MIKTEKIKNAPTRSKKQNKTKPKKGKQLNPLHRITTTKNVSSVVKNGTIVQTRDEYFEGMADYRKPGYENKGNYRKAVVVDSNRNDELALVKLTTSKKGENIGEKSRFRPFILTIDDENKPIKLSIKFIKTKNKISKSKVDEIKIKALRTGDKRKKANRKRLRVLKNRE